MVAESGRILAQAARREGMAVRVIDRFGDADTRAASRDLRVVSGWDGPEDPGLEALVERFSPAAKGEPVLWGGGLEARPGLLERLAGRRDLLGNGGEVVRRVTDPDRWFPLLAGLGLPHPESRLAPPASPDDWLAKEAGASGGGHIRPGRGAGPRAGRYFQRRCPGTPLSLLFAADGRRAQVLGVTEQWTAGEQNGDPEDFRYGGGLGHADPGRRLSRALEEAVAALTARLGLRGLNGLDCLVEGDAFHLLEVNPRPVASLALYAGDLAPGPIALHRSGSRGRLPAVRIRPPGPYRGHAVVYAEEPVRVPPGLLAPWCGDRPGVGTWVPAGAPVCTVQAAHRVRGEARRLLGSRHRRVRQWLRAAAATTVAHA
jgi:predicted ATP-grasp superfamily ATP-dependent carboligase